MGFQTPQYTVARYIEWARTGHLQLPDFQRGYKWEDERIRQLLVTVASGHPMGIVMLLKTANDQGVRFKPKPIEGTDIDAAAEPKLLLLDGQQRLTSLTQALSGTGVVATKDSRGKLMDRRYYIDIATALEGPDRIDEAVFSLPGDGIERENFGRDIVRDLSTEERERDAGCFPFRLLIDPMLAAMWLTAQPGNGLFTQFLATIVQKAQAYSIPAIELDESTTKAAVTTVFEKVNIGGLPLNVFELLTATFAGDGSYYAKHGVDFRLNDDWQRTRAQFAQHPVLAAVENTHFLQAVSLLATLRRNRLSDAAKPPAVSARREDLLKLTLADYLEWVEPLRVAFAWAATFLADQYIFEDKFLPYPTQLVPLAAIKVVLGSDADLHGVRTRLSQWYWCGILGELYGGSTETQFARDVDQVPGWALGKETQVPRTVHDANFVQSRLLSLTTRRAAAYKGIYSLVLAKGARDWMYDKALDKVQYVNLAVDIHHIFPYQWCLENGIDPARRDSIVNKTAIAASTNRAIGGVAPSKYLDVIEKKAQISSVDLNSLLETHAVSAEALRADNFNAHFDHRMGELIAMIEQVTGKTVQRDLDTDEVLEGLAQFDPEDVEVDAAGEGDEAKLDAGEA